MVNYSMGQGGKLKSDWGDRMFPKTDPESLIFFPKNSQSFKELASGSNNDYIYSLVGEYNTVGFWGVE